MSRKRKHSFYPLKVCSLITFSSSIISECTKRPDRSTSDDPGVNSAAIGGGIGGGLALLTLLIVAAALYRRFKKKSSVDDVSNAADQTTATGVTPVVKIDEAPNSIPPAGTN